MTNKLAVQKPETNRLTRETPLEDLPRKTRSYLTFVRECSLILPSTSQAILGQGQDISVHVIWFCQHWFRGTQVLQKKARGVIRQRDRLYDLGGIIAVEANVAE